MHTSAKFKAARKLFILHSQTFAKFEYFILFETGRNNVSHISISSKTAFLNVDAENLIICSTFICNGFVNVDHLTHGSIELNSLQS